ncbi:MAG: NPCBM/NEW2 domain-containing protein [Lentisphaeria bacterium]|nr:NPCBM/NEW2 domain-containing protein [Lentisphaeria bacterium]NQZ69870.1 NPCBM/NEW2 domain-containing protein [Lentisphaeria bacterium]
MRKILPVSGMCGIASIIDERDTSKGESVYKLFFTGVTFSMNYTLLFLFFGIIQLSHAQELVTTSAERLAGSVSLLKGQLKIGKKSVSIKACHSVIFNPIFSGKKENFHYIFLTDGSIVSGHTSGFSRTKGAIDFTTLLGEKLSFPLSAIHSILYAGSAKIPDYKQNGLHVRLKNKQAIKATIDYMTPMLIGLREGKTKHRLKKDRISRIDNVGVQIKVRPQDDLLISRYGDRLYGSIETITAKTVLFRFNKQALELPLSVVSRIEFGNASRVSLTEIKPSSHTNTAFLDRIHATVYNKTLFGFQLSLGRCYYNRGIAAQSKTVLSYSLNSAYKLFSFTVGLDGRAGHAQVIIKGDNAVLFDEPVRPDLFKSIQLPLNGVRILQVIVDYGKFGSGGDYVLLTEPILIKK